MSEVIKTATRDAYGKALVELGNTDAKVLVLDADLAAATKTGMFKKEHPEKFIDCGIAEGNMMGIAAGLAASGYTVFASSFAMFAAGRAFEQVRNSIGYPHLNVKIGATHAGISVGEDGASHQCCEDIALMRSIPGMVIINPADDIEARAAVFAAATTAALSRGFIVCILINSTEMPSASRTLLASIASFTIRPVAIIETSVPSANCTPFPGSNL